MKAVLKTKAGRIDMAGYQRKPRARKAKAVKARISSRPLKSLHLKEMLPELSHIERYVLGRITGEACYFKDGEFFCIGLPDADAKSLAGELGVTPDFIRRGIGSLAERGLLCRWGRRGIWLPVCPREVLAGLLSRYGHGRDEAEAMAAKLHEGLPAYTGALRSLHFRNAMPPKASPTQIYVLGRVYGESLHVRGDGSFFGPGFCKMDAPSLAGEIGISVRTASRALAALEEAGALFRDLRGRIIITLPQTQFRKTMEELGHAEMYREWMASRGLREDA